MPYWQNCVIESRDKTPQPRGLVPLAMAALSLGASLPARADAQRDPELRAIVSAAITSADCFPDKFESAVWYTLMEPKLRRSVADPAERMQILKTAFCEAHRPGRAAPATGPYHGGDGHREPLRSLGRVVGRRRGPDAGDAVLARASWA